MAVTLDHTQVHTLLLLEFKKGLNTHDAVEDLNKAFGSSVVTERTAQRWYERFSEGDFQLSDHFQHRLDDEKLRKLIKEKPGLAAEEYASELGFSPATVQKHLLNLGK
ncbi:unnamed protein product [Bursaphelenchus xylophilus]|uniref:(pine wood nematode) hypothetical protein n=1 Tax=Bursaphelenchus xylophilus TaxID=6326 RepID=A0A1I7RNK9_BURXY|nr:unnamed protein product [Bursaphelenchus xylophilus]CAG9124127.1 unnamed protein product [Bursaphelenchus xylophilus]